jgi:hypothetical protein
MARDMVRGVPVAYASVRLGVQQAEQVLQASLSLLNTLNMS